MKFGLCIVFIIIGLTVVIFFSSCCLFTVNKYDVAFRNIGTHSLFVTSEKIGNYIPPIGILIAGAYAGSGGHLGIPESIKIKWKKDNGEIVEREVKVKENLPTRFGNNDTIIFNINDNDDIILSFERWGDKEIDSKGNEVTFKNYPAPLPAPDDKAK